VALVASAIILYAVIYLAHGVSLRTSAALLGTLTSLLLAAGLSWAAIELAHLTGLSEDQNNEVAAYMGHISITGLLLAGFIIGSLGVLNGRHRHAGLDGVRAGERHRKCLAPNHFRGRDAGGPRPYRQYRLHTGAGLRRQFPTAAAVVQCGQPVSG
jgi:hypothetical protein